MEAYANFIVGFDLAFVSQEVVDGDRQLLNLFACEALVGVLLADIAHQSSDA